MFVIEKVPGGIKFVDALRWLQDVLRGVNLTIKQQDNNLLIELPLDVLANFLTSSFYSEDIKITSSGQHIHLAIDKSRLLKWLQQAIISEDIKITFEADKIYIKLPDNSILSHHIAPQVIKGQHIAKGSVDADKIAPGAIQAHHIAKMPFSFDKIQVSQAHIDELVATRIQSNSILSPIFVIYNDNTRHEINAEGYVGINPISVPPFAGELHVEFQASGDGKYRLLWENQKIDLPITKAQAYGYQFMTRHTTTRQIEIYFKGKIEVKNILIWGKITENLGRRDDVQKDIHSIEASN